VAELHASILRMLSTLKTKTRYAIEVAIAFTPWVISMAHRGKIAVVILAIGMGLSFLVQSYFSKHDRK